MKNLKILPDINVWLALIFSNHKFSLSAQSWFNDLSRERLYFCRFTQQGLLRISTNQKAFKEDVLSMQRAWEVYDLLLSDERIYFDSKEPAKIEKLWRGFTNQSQAMSKIWSDAYIASYAASKNFSLVTFDKGFKNYSKSINVIILA